MDCKNCKDEWCHVCQIGVDPVRLIALRLLPEHYPEASIIERWEEYTRSGIIYLSGCAEDDRGLHRFMNTPLPYGFVPFENKY